MSIAKITKKGQITIPALQEKARHKHRPDRDGGRENNYQARKKAWWHAEKICDQK